jgi:hypothetical protein
MKSIIFWIVTLLPIGIASIIFLIQEIVNAIGYQYVIGLLLLVVGFIIARSFCYSELDDFSPKKYSTPKKYPVVKAQQTFEIPKIKKISSDETLITDKIISILSNNKQLTTNKILSMINKETGIKVSYSLVHQYRLGQISMKQLCDELSLK